MSWAGAAAQAPSGPRWVAGAQVYDRQTDGRGVLWLLVEVEPGGRVLHWESTVGARKARTEATADHPDYPSDLAVLEAQRAERRARAKALSQ